MSSSTESFHVDAPFSDNEQLATYVEMVAQNAFLQERTALLTAELHEKNQEIEALRDERDGAIESLVRETRFQLGTAMSIVSDFAKENRRSLSGVILGTSEGGFRFVFLTSGAGIDWDFTDELADLECEFTKKVPGLPISCMSVPADAEDCLAGEIVREVLSRLHESVLS